MKIYVYLIALTVYLFSCSSDDENNTIDHPIEEKEILYLQVNYTDNAFMGGTILNSTNTTDLITYNEFVEPGDFGNLKVYEQGTDILLFDGDVIWAGIGERISPENISSPESFSHVLTDDFQTPHLFDEIWQYYPFEHEIEIPWGAIQSLELVREKLIENQNLSVKYFLYTPGVGDVDENEAYWVFLIK